MLTKKLTRLIIALLVISSPLFCETFYESYAGQLATTVLAAPAELFFSEYVEGSGHNSALELFNGAAAPVDLAAANYDIQFFFDGSPTPDVTIALTGLIAPGDVYALAHAEAVPDILAQADQLSTEPFFDGNDAVLLRREGQVIDSIGQTGFLPDTGWGSGQTGTANNTLRRKTSIETGDADGSDPFEPALEWDSFGADNFDDLGRHGALPPPSPSPPPPPPPLAVVINEVAWGGTGADAADEWLELFNPGSEPVDLTDWTLTGSADSQPVNIALTGTIPPGGYWLLERQADDSVADLQADQIYSFSSGLANGGEVLYLRERNGAVIDTANIEGEAWPGGSGSPTYLSMERIDPHAPDAAGNWRSNDALTRNGLDAAGQLLNGTPKQPNSTPTDPPPPPPPADPPPPPPPTDPPPSPPPDPPPAQPGSVVINEVAWGGAAANASDEWLELLNTTTQTVALDGWVITSTNGLNIDLAGTEIGPQAFYLIERSDDTAISDIAAELAAGFGRGLNNDGDALFLSANGLVVDTANGGGGSWPAGSGAPDYFSMERLDPTQPDSDANWRSNNGLTRNGLDAAGQPLNGTPKQPNSTTTDPPPPPPPPDPPPPSTPVTPTLLLIGEFLYDGQTPSTEGDEFIEICNPNTEPANLTGYKVGDEEVKDGGESMYQLPDGLLLAPDACLIIAKDAAAFQARFGFPPDFAVGELTKHTAWGRGNWALSNSGDELLLLGPADQILDSVAYRNGDYAGLGLEPDASAPAPHSLQRVWPVDTDSMPHDFVRTDPTPGHPTAPPLPPAAPPPPAALPGGMYAYWGDLHGHTSYSDGAGPPHYALALARAAGLHYYSITDHGWWLESHEWTKTLSQTKAATVPGEFIALRGIEWSHAELGHINVFNSDTLISRNHPLFSDLSDFYTWLAANPDVIAQFNHPDPSYGGTFADFALHPAAAQVTYLQEIGNSAQKYTTYEPSFIRSNTLGWRVAPTNNGDGHSARWGAETAARTGIVAPALTQDDLLAAMRARRVFATEDSNLALTLRLDGAWMGATLPPTGDLSLMVDMVDPDPEPLTLYLYDRNLLLATASLASSTGQWQMTVEALPGRYFWVKAVQADGDTAYTAPVWIEGQAPVETVYINEILPAPIDRDWDGDGTNDHRDEWLELYNPSGYPVGLGGWQLRDTSRVIYDLPLDLTIPARGFITLYQTQTGIAFNNGGDTISLSRSDGTVADAFSYDRSPGYDETWCRLPDGQSRWSQDCLATPNETNREWVYTPAEPLEVNIYDAKRLTYDAWVRVTGRVTAPPGLFGDRTMYIQDHTAGIMIYLPKNRDRSFNLGDKVRLEGNLRTFREEFEIAVRDRSDLSFLEPGQPPPPLPIATTSLLEPYEGLLVMLQGQAVQFRGRTLLWINDGTDPAKVYIRTSTGIKKPFIEPGAPLTIVGIVSQYSEGIPTRDDYRLMPRYQFDLVLPEPPPSAPPANWPTLLPETGG